MLPGRAVATAGAVGGEAAPDALVGAEAVTVLLRRRVVTAGTVAPASAVSAFRAHDAFLHTAVVYHNSERSGGENE